MADEIFKDSTSFICTNCKNPTSIRAAWNTERIDEKLCVKCYEYIHDILPTSTRAGTVRESNEIAKAYKAIDEMLNCGETQPENFNERYDE